MRSTVLSFLLLSLWGGAAALAAWVVCRLLRRAHAPSRFLCWLWLAVGLRFVLPFGIPLALPRPQNIQSLPQEFCSQPLQLEHSASLCWALSGWKVCL